MERNRRPKKFLKYFPKGVKHLISYAENLAGKDIFRAEESILAMKGSAKSVIMKDFPDRIE